MAGFTNPLNPNDVRGDRRKISSLGSVLDKGPDYKMLPDGTIKYYRNYYNWAIDGDKTKHTFRNILQDEESKNPQKWLEKFEKLYSIASYVYIDISDYLFKINGVWYLVESFQKGKELGIDLKIPYPPKENQDVRLMELRDLRSGKMDKDTTLVNIIGYQETDSEDGGWFNPISYSAGNYFIELYMPLGDTIKIKRHGSMGINMQFYKMPVTQGGRNDVVFIVQEPNEMYPDKEFEACTRSGQGIRNRNNTASTKAVSTVS